jgi:hypothetical protein
MRAQSTMQRRLSNHGYPMRSAGLVSVLVHLLAVMYLPSYTRTPKEPDAVVELTLLAEPAPGENAGGSDVPEPVVTQAAEAPPPQKPAPQRPAKAPSAVKAPVSEVEPTLQTPEPVAAAPAPPRPTTFSGWQSARHRSLPGLGPRLPIGTGRGGRGQDLVRSRGTKQCLPRGGQLPEVVYLLIDSSGSMNGDWQAQAISCAHQYIKAAMAGGASIAIGNFADQSTFTAPTRDMVDIGIALRGRSNGRGTALPAAQLGAVFEPQAGLHADLVILSDGVLPNYRDAMPWYEYFLDLNSENRGYLYTVGSEGPKEVTHAFENAGFEVYVYRII